MKKLNKNFIIGGGLFLLFVIFTVFVKFVGVEPIGPLGSKVGLAGLNELFMLSSNNKVWDIISDVIMVLALCGALAFVVLGVVQLIKRKSLKKVDKNLYLLAGLYAVVVCFYVFFELVVINHRPILENGELVASFPSTHVFLVTTLVFAALSQLSKFYIPNKNTMFIIDDIAIILETLLVVSRMLSGVHWFTDIVGALLLSASLVFIFNGVTETFINNKDKTLD
ncbi:MAG: phosphatase PAP2 family protein [Clostridia bacterium]|nr:phosphatase PAP2 family protein [Clostridia bacterium]